MVFRRTRSPYLPQRPFRLHSTMQNPAIVVKNHRFLPPIRSVATEKVVSYLSHTLRSRVVTQNEARPGVTWNLRIVICEFHVVPGLFCFRATSGNRSLTLHAAEGPRGRRGPSTAKGQGNDDDFDPGYGTWIQVLCRDGKRRLARGRGESPQVPAGGTGEPYRFAALRQVGGFRRSGGHDAHGQGQQFYAHRGYLARIE